MLSLGFSGINSRLIKYLAARGAGKSSQEKSFPCRKNKIYFRIRAKG